MSLAFDPERWWPAPLLPRRDGRGLALLFVIAALSFLAGLAAVGALAGERAAAGWRSELTGSATVIVRPQGSDTPDEAAARAEEAVAGVKGVAQALPLDNAKTAALLAPWIGPGGLPADLPTPRLIAVELDPKAPATGDALRQALKDEGLDADVDDHSRWAAQIMRAGAAVAAIGAGFFALILSTLGAVIAFATREGLAARREVVEALHLAGATDGFIARLFQARFARSVAQAALVGAVLAIGAAAAVKLSSAGDEQLTALLPIAWSDLAAPAPFPVLGALVAAVTARLTAMAALAGKP
ncbi:MAG TPA: ABC transporter permease [Caulobacteraceae bacterium]|jgi:cell division transport system permease protein|nr:ABC transporter permease [Caulobacteraceae bacterium]